MDVRRSTARAAAVVEIDSDSDSDSDARASRPKLRTRTVVAYAPSDDEGDEDDEDDEDDDVDKADDDEDEGEGEDAGDGETRVTAPPARAPRKRARDEEDAYEPQSDTQTREEEEADEAEDLDDESVSEAEESGRRRSARARKPTVAFGGLDDDFVDPRFEYIAKPRRERNAGVRKVAPRQPAGRASKSKKKTKKKAKYSSESDSDDAFLASDDPSAGAAAGGTRSRQDSDDENAFVIDKIVAREVHTLKEWARICAQKTTRFLTNMSIFLDDDDDNGGDKEQQPSADATEQETTTVAAAATASDERVAVRESLLESASARAASASEAATVDAVEGAATSTSAAPTDEAKITESDAVMKEADETVAPDSASDGGAAAKREPATPPAKLSSAAGRSVSTPISISEVSQTEERFLVKWKGLSYLHVSWENEKALLGVDKNAKGKIQRFRDKELLGLFDGTVHGDEYFNPEFRIVDRILDIQDRPGDDFSPEDSDDENGEQKFRFFYVKWKALSYDALTWEREDDVDDDAAVALYEDRLTRAAARHKRVAQTASQKKSRKELPGPYLIIAPLSTLAHWQREFLNWTYLDAVVYHGSATARKNLQDYEFFLTEEEYARADEYAAKRSGPARAHKSTPTASVVARSKRDNYRFDVLITTPEMCATADFAKLTRVQWQTLVRFLARFGDLKDMSQVEQLHSELKPFLLRRMKEDVEKSLAPKEETIVEVELTVLQKQYYRAIYEMNTEFLSRGRKKVQTPSLMNVAMELRKCCNHPFLIKGVEEQEIIRLRQQTQQTQTQKLDASAEDAMTRQVQELLVTSSGKLVLLDKLLPRLKENGHRVLIFSQFKIMLDILQDYLRLRAYHCERIDGNITGNDRQAAIDRKDATGLLTAAAGGSSSKAKASGPSKDEIENLLKHGAYEIFKEEKEGDAEAASKRFSEESIDQILSRSTKIVHDPKAVGDADGKKSLMSSFSKATFVSSANPDEQVALDDPDFWTKVIGLQEVAEKPVEPSPLKKRRRRPVKSYLLDDSDVEAPSKRAAKKPKGMLQERDNEEYVISDDDDDESDDDDELDDLDDEEFGGGAGAGKRKKEKDIRASTPPISMYTERIAELLTTFGYGRWDEMLKHSKYLQAYDLHDLQLYTRQYIAHSIHVAAGTALANNTPLSNGELPEPLSSTRKIVLIDNYADRFSFAALVLEDLGIKRMSTVALPKNLRLKPTSVKAQRDANTRVQQIERMHLVQKIVRSTLGSPMPMVALVNDLQQLQDRERVQEILDSGILPDTESAVASGGASPSTTSVADDPKFQNERKEALRRLRALPDVGFPDTVAPWWLSILDDVILLFYVYKDGWFKGRTLPHQLVNHSSLFGARSAKYPPVEWPTVSVLTKRVKAIISAWTNPKRLRLHMQSASAGSKAPLPVASAAADHATAAEAHASERHAVSASYHATTTPFSSVKHNRFAKIVFAFGIPDTSTCRDDQERLEKWRYFIQDDLLSVGRQPLVELLAEALDLERCCRQRTLNGPAAGADPQHISASVVDSVLGGKRGFWQLTSTQCRRLLQRVDLFRLLRTQILVLTPGQLVDVVGRVVTSLRADPSKNEFPRWWSSPRHDILLLQGVECYGLDEYLSLVWKLPLFAQANPTNSFPNTTWVENYVNALALRCRRALQPPTTAASASASSSSSSGAKRPPPLSSPSPAASTAPGAAGVVAAAASTPAGPAKSLKSARTSPPPVVVTVRRETEVRQRIRDIQGMRAEDPFFIPAMRKRQKRESAAAAAWTTSARGDEEDKEEDEDEKEVRVVSATQAAKKPRKQDDDGAKASSDSSDSETVASLRSRQLLSQDGARPQKARLSSTRSRPSARSSPPKMRTRTRAPRAWDVIVIDESDDE
ncbi:hypothetical protein PybrP1_006326 [[Pythium] brassicae (nom. inval.)]|nr:hypothetical protein PybrP1_006326 [[Pythium] brassicae (nom. inval.)]